MALSSTSTGKEVLRENMPAGVVTFNTSASGKVGGSEENEFHLHELFDVPLRTGRNLIAVEIHQENPRSSDIRFDLKLTGSDQKLSQVGLLRGPYLQVGTSSSMILRWRTRRPSSSVVRYGTAPDQLKGKVEIKEKSLEHEVLIMGLKSRTQYFYSIGDGEEVLAGGDSDHFFLLRLNLVAMAQCMHGLSVIAVLPTPMPKLFTTLTLRLREIVTQIYG